MNNITTSTIADPNKQQPFLGGSLAFLQNASKEMIVGICRAMMGEALYNSGFAVCMCGGTFNSSLDQINNAYIFFNGELYFFNGVSGMNGYSNVPVFIASNSFLSPDPITYSDGSTGSVHQQRRLTVADQVSGTGLFDLSTMKYVPAHNGTSVATTTTSTTTGTPVPITGATYTTPKARTGITRKFRIRFTCNVSVPSTSGLEQWLIEIYNSTASAVIASQTTACYPVASNLLTLPCVIETVVPAIGGTVTIIARVTKFGSNVTVANGFFVVDEVF